MTQFQQRVISVLLIVLMGSASDAAVENDPLYELGYIVVTNYPGVSNDGTGDSTAGIQQAIDDAYALKKTVLFPGGTYLISYTLKCYTWHFWNPARLRYHSASDEFCHTLWGSKESENRPIIKLISNTALFDDSANPRPMISYRNFRAYNAWATQPIEPTHPLGTPANFKHLPASLFVNDLRGIDFDCSGHAGAFGIFYPAAQNSTLEDIRVDATGAYAGIWGVPGRSSGGMNLEGEGGKRGIILEESLAGALLVGVNLFNQTEAAISMGDFMPITLIGFHIKKDRGPVMTTARLETRNSTGTLTLIDGIVEVGTNTVVLDNSDGLNVYVRNLFVSGSNQLIESPSGIVAGSGLWKHVREYVYTDQTQPAGDPPYEVGDKLFRVFNLLDGVVSQIAEPATDILNQSSAPPRDLVERHIYVDLPLYEGTSDGTINITQPPYNAIANDGLADDVAIQAAIDAAVTGNGRVFIPAGTFLLTHTVKLASNTILFGAGRFKSIITYHEDWKPTSRVPMLDTVNDPDATTFIGFLSLKVRGDGGAITPERTPTYDNMDHLRWRVGRNSCLYGVSLFSEHSGKPNNPHRSIEINGSGGGRFYFITSQGAFNKANADYRFVYIEGTREPLWFYGLNGEATKAWQYWGGNPCDSNVEIVNSENVCILSFKREGDSPSVIVRDSKNIALYSSGGMRDGTFSGSGGYVQIRGDSDQILIANLLVQTASFMPNGEPLLLEALDDGITNQVTWPEGVSFYKRGVFDDGAISLGAKNNADFNF